MYNNLIDFFIIQIGFKEHLKKDYNKKVLLLITRLKVPKEISNILDDVWNKVRGPHAHNTRKYLSKDLILKYLNLYSNVKDNLNENIIDLPKNEYLEKTQDSIRFQNQKDEYSLKIMDFESQPQSFYIVMQINLINCHLDSFDKNFEIFFKDFFFSGEIRSYHYFYEFKKDKLLIDDLNFRSGRIFVDGSLIFSYEFKKEQKNLSLFKIMNLIMHNLLILFAIYRFINWNGKIKYNIRVRNIGSLSLKIDNRNFSNLEQKYSLPEGESNLEIDRRFNFSLEKENIINELNEFLIEFCKKFGFDYQSSKHLIKEILKNYTFTSSHQYGNNKIFYYIFREEDF